MLPQVFSSIDRIQNAEVRKRCHSALEVSIQWPGVVTGELPVSCAQIIQSSGLAKEVLGAHSVFLSKYSVQEYLTHLGVVVNLPTIKKVISGRAIAEKFHDGRPAIVIQRKLFFTYAECRYLFDIHTQE